VIAFVLWTPAAAAIAHRCINLYRYQCSWILEVRSSSRSMALVALGILAGVVAVGSFFGFSGQAGRPERGDS
jgi:hypothetical protein